MRGSSGEVPIYIFRVSGLFCNKLKLLGKIEKNCWNWRLKAEYFQNLWDQYLQTVKGQNNFCSWGFLISNELEQLGFKLKKIFGLGMQEKLENNQITIQRQTFGSWKLPFLIFLTFPADLWIPIIFFNLWYDWSNILHLRNCQEQFKKVFYSKNCTFKYNTNIKWSKNFCKF